MAQEQHLKDKETKLLVWLKTKLPNAQDISISPLERAPSGWCNDNYFFNLRWKDEAGVKEERLVVRWPSAYPVYQDYDLAKQFRIMQCLQDSGVPVPKTYWIEEDEDVLGSVFFVMEFVQGEAPPDTPPGYHGYGMLYDMSPQERAQVWWKAVEMMARIHDLDWEKLGLSFLGVPEDKGDAIDRQISFWEDTLRWTGLKPSDVLEKSFEWLKENRIEAQRISLCWGDPRLPNLVYRDGEVVGALDWEFAYLGDPATDLAWFLCLDRYSRQVPRLDGMPQWDETIEFYERVTGRSVSHLTYHQVLAMVKGAVGVVETIKAVLEGNREGNYTADMARDNIFTRKLANMLGIEHR